MYQFLVIIQYIGILFLLLESGYIFAKWKTSTQGYLFFNCVATLVNNAGYLMEMLAKTEEEYLMALQLSYMGRVWIPYSLFVFMLAICKINFSQKLLVGLGFFHGITFLLVFTCQYHTLYYTTREYVIGDLFPYLECGHGPWYILYMSTLVFYIVYGLIKLFQTVAREKNPTVKTRLSFVVGAITIESLFFFVNMTGITGCYDITVMGYTIGTVFMYVALFKFDLLDTLILAKDYVLDEVSEGIITVNGDNRIEYLNRTAKSILADDVNASDSIIRRLKEAIEENQPIEIKDRIYSPEVKVFYQNDFLQASIYVLVDDTEHYQYLKELKAQKEIAEAANASKTAFLSIVSHEIRTPMNAIVGMTELLLRDELTEKQRKYMTNIKNSGASLVMIINDILDQSKLDAGKMEIVEEPYELRPLIEDVHMIIENRIGSKPIHLMEDIDENIPSVLIGDALRIRQIFINLMNNAVKFTENGYIQLSARMVAETDEAYLIRFGVKDSGQGIREKDLKKLGEAFIQVNTKGNHKKEGTGLGLSISRDFIKLMGGELKVQSVYGRGSEFYFIIEQKKTDEIISDTQNANFAWKPKNFTAPDARILVVDDGDLNRLIAKEILEPIQIKTDVAESGSLAIEMIQKNDYDVVFMDYMMPEMDGIETTDRIRKLAMEEYDYKRAEYYKSVPIIALTGDSSSQTQERFKNAGINDFIEKPIEFERMKKVLLKWLPEELIRG